MPQLVTPLLIFAAYYLWSQWFSAPKGQRDSIQKAVAWGAALLVLIYFAVRSGQLLLAGVVALAMVGLRLVPELGAARRDSGVRPGSSEAPRSGTATSKQMSRSAALQILDLPASASAAEIKERYRTLIKAVHPDRGGSAFLAAQLNEAHRTLLG